ncbi:MAG: AAA family ATPase [Kiritimatiellia bacterium]
MILQKLIIENFRQFHGHQEIEFATGKTKNVTLIHAENGFGKTALLNALLWGFYGRDGLTDDLPQPDAIIHEGLARSKKKAETSAHVTILFEDDGDTYMLTRSISLLQQEDNPVKTKLELMVTRDGQTYEESKPQLKIDAILPPGISPFLFFNGERIDHLAMVKNAASITSAIHQVLGLHILRQTIRDLEHPNVRGRLMAELRDKTDTDTQRHIDRLAEMEREIEESRRRLADCTANQSALAGEISAIDARLAANHDARELQGQRTLLEAEKKELERRIQELSGRLATLISEDGYTLFAADLVNRGKAIVQRLRAEHKIPARVLNVFIEDLLKQGACICGCELKEGTEAHERVKELLTIAGDQHFNNAVGALDNAIGVIDGAVVRTRSTLRALSAERASARSRMHEVVEHLEEIHKALGDQDTEEIHNLEATRESRRLRQRELDREHGALDAKLAGQENEHDNLRRQIALARQQDAAAAKTQRRIQALDAAIELLNEILSYEMEDLRGVLVEEINSHFQKIIDREYWVDLSKEFVLSLRKRLSLDDGNELDIEVAHSQGQRQITSLVFIASLVALAQRRQEMPTILRGLEGGHYPMVMDSPFGQLGDEFRSGVAKWIPSLAPQVIVMVSSSQYKGAVESELGSSRRIGRRYMLCYNGPSKRKDAATRISIAGRSHVQYREAKVEFTEVREIEGA